MTNFKPSQYQQDIFKWIESGSGDGFVQAVAGSGKTTTLVEGAKKLKGSKALFLAFNKSIADYLSEKLPQNMEAKTFHSLGNSCLFKMLGAAQPVDEYKYRNLANKEAQHILNKIKSSVKNRLGEATLYLHENTIAKQLTDLVHFAMVTLTDPSDRNTTLNMIRHFGIDIDFEQPIIFNELLSAATRIIANGEERARNAKIIDFDDMIYLPVQWNLRLPKYDWIFVDEAQDLSKAQLELALRARGQGGRILFVGDKHQAIYGFAGANCDSVDEIIKETGAKELPLSICYRCPTSHLNLAREIVPYIEPRPDAPEGDIETIKLDKLSGIVQEGDLILSRTTAPLVELCIELISKNIPARVRGRDIGTSITSIAQEISRSSGFTYSKLPIYVKDWEQQKLEKLQSNPDNEDKIQSLRDRCQSIIACYEGFDCYSIEQLCNQLEKLFSDDRLGVILSTIHRAKGLQNRRVMILDYEKLPLKWLGQKSHELEQEWNLKYVALTRAEEVLFLVQTSQKVEETSNRNNFLPNRNEEQPKTVPQTKSAPKPEIVSARAGKRETAPTIQPIVRPKVQGNNAEMSYKLGIDLGTTNSVVSVWRNGKIETLTIEGDELMPSVVSFHPDGSCMVGKSAKRRFLLYPEQSVASSKRYMGDINKLYQQRGEYLSPTDIAKLILEKIAKVAQQALGEEVKDAVITVPAYFNEAQRAETKKAAEEAGLNVLRLIPEPTAAAIAYGIDTSRNQTLMVYDLGGGTFDVSILVVKNNSFEAKAVGGDIRLGGDDFDQAIVDWACKEFKAQSGIDLNSHPKKETELAKLKELAEQVKIELSSAYDACLFTTCLGHSLELNISRNEYNKLINPLLERTITIMKSVLADAGLTALDIDRVILVGGSTHTPAVREMLAREIKDPYTASHVALVVSHGAAYLAAGKCPQISEVTGHSLGIDMRDGNDKLFFKPIIPRQTTYPCRLGVLGYTRDAYQEQVQMKVYRGENNDPEENTYLGELHLPVLPPQKEKVPVAAIFDLDANGIIHFTAVQLPVGGASQGIRQYALENNSSLDLSAVDVLIERGQAKTQMITIEEALER
ncbi:Hsp70 family protein [Ancylothrix sp. C2]|uniref:Hsp70 family protein n=1 Tax=Ancylothrix sp. D3o TaxID=2953691 RepID=UPI0021BBA9AB|nr:Hsp70 family protein [Ancylothrix sp. D3o]MCT7952981.1 Hsp70 family protein [Ancylothrix sp. D3o]